MTGKEPGKTDEKDAEKPEVENRQSRIAVFLEKIGEEDEDQYGKGHDLDDIENLIQQGRESFRLIKTGHVKHDTAHKEDDDKEGKMLTPGGDIFCQFNESTLKTQEIGQKPWQRDEEKIRDDQKGDKYLVIFFKQSQTPLLLGDRYSSYLSWI